MKKHHFTVPAVQGSARPPHLLAVNAAALEGYVFVWSEKITLEKQSIAESREAYIFKQLERVNRLDIVWDVYIPDSLTCITRENRGKGIRKRVLPSTVMPKNKTELFSLLSREMIFLPIADDKKMYATCGTGVICSPVESDLTSLD